MRPFTALSREAFDTGATAPGATAPGSASSFALSHDHPARGPRRTRRSEREAPCPELACSPSRVTSVRRAGLEGALRELVEFASRRVAGCSGACVTATDHGVPFLCIAAGVEAVAVEQTRAWADVGPCLREPTPGWSGDAATGWGERGVAPGSCGTDPWSGADPRKSKMLLSASLCMPIPTGIVGLYACLHLYSSDVVCWPSSTVRLAHDMAHWAGEIIFQAVLPASESAQGGAWPRE